jgi:hypothetical protein
VRPRCRGGNRASFTCVTNDAHWFEAYPTARGALGTASVCGLEASPRDTQAKAVQVVRFAELPERVRELLLATLAPAA